MTKYMRGWNGQYSQTLGSRCVGREVCVTGGIVTLLHPRHQHLTVSIPSHTSGYVAAASWTELGLCMSFAYGHMYKMQ